MMKMIKIGVTFLVLTVSLCSCMVWDGDDRVIPPPEKEEPIFGKKTPSVIKKALANFYGHYTVGKIDYEAALRLFEVLRNSDEADRGVANFFLGYAEINGICRKEIDYERADYFFRQAKIELEKNPQDIDGNQSLAWAMMYRDGYGVEKNLEKVLPLLEKSEQSGNDFAPLLIAEFMLKNSQFGENKEYIKSKLFKARQFGFPQAYYLFGYFFPSFESANYLNVSAEKKYPPAMIEVALTGGNNFAIEEANLEAMALGYHEAFYNLSKTADNEIERIYLLKQASLRGNIEAIKELAEYYESGKIWSKAIVYNLFLLRDPESASMAKLALARLDNICGLNVLLEQIWLDRHYSELSLLDSDVAFFINSYTNNVPNLREDYQKYLSVNCRKSFANCDWYYIFSNKLPSEFAGDVFKVYRGVMEPDLSNIDDKNTYFFNYAVAAGMAGQGGLQSEALKQIEIAELPLEKSVLAVKLLVINSQIMLGRQVEAEKMLAELKIEESNKDFTVNFINGCAVALLKNREQTAALLKLNLNALLEYPEVKKQPFFNFKTGKDLGDVMFEEPEL